MIATHLVRRARAALFLSVFASPLLAQHISVPDSAAAGSEVQVQYCNPAMAGKRVVLLVSGGTPLSTHEIFVTLDATGTGSAPWIVNAGWTSAYFSGPDGAGASMDVD
jgi:hypothetical protein